MPILTRDKFQFYKRVLICTGHPDYVSRADDRLLGFSEDEAT